MHWLVPSLNRCVPDGNLYLPCLLQAREDRLLSLVLVAQRAEFFAIEHPLFTPLCSGPKTVSKPSRRKQFPSCYKGPNLWIMIRDAGNRIRDSALLSKGAGAAGANSVVLPLLLCGVYI
jgi:hypothetical protein